MEKPAVLTLTGDNALTVGVMMALLYLGALLLAQLWIRVPGIMSKNPAPSPMPMPQTPGNQVPQNAGQGAGY